jgi:hypothetical protein
MNYQAASPCPQHTSGLMTAVTMRLPCITLVELYCTVLGYAVTFWTALFFAVHNTFLLVQCCSFVVIRVCAPCAADHAALCTADTQPRGLGAPSPTRP